MQNSWPPCPEFTWTVSFVSSDFETENGPDSTAMQLGSVRRALYMRCMLYRSRETEDDKAKLMKTLVRDELSARDGICVFYGYHSQRAQRVNEGINSEGVFDPGCWERLTERTTYDAPRDGKDSSSDDEVSSASPVPKKKKVVVEAAIPLPNGPGDPCWVDAIQCTVNDVIEFMDYVSAEELFQTLAHGRLAGVDEVVRYILRCNKTPGDVMKLLGDKVPLRAIAPALLASGYDKTSIRTAVRSVPEVFQQADIDDAGLNTGALIERAEHQCYSDSSEADAAKGKGGS